MIHTDDRNSGADDSSEAIETVRDWFAFRVRPRHEKSVTLQLRDKNEECFLPLLTTKRRWGKRDAHVELPLISGYVFCRSHRYGMLPILKTPGVVDVIRSGNSPLPIPPSEISALERAIDAAVPIESCPYVAVGQTVTIKSGPLAGVVGIVRDCRKPEHIVLSVSLLRRSVLVQIELAHFSIGEETHKISQGSENRLVNCA
jgi:transcription antitermination factor NusG